MSNYISLHYNQFVKKLQTSHGKLWSMVPKQLSFQGKFPYRFRDSAFQESDDFIWVLAFHDRTSRDDHVSTSLTRQEIKQFISNDFFSSFKTLHKTSIDCHFKWNYSWTMSSIGDAHSKSNRSKKPEITLGYASWNGRVLSHCLAIKLGDTVTIGCVFTFAKYPKYAGTW